MKSKILESAGLVDPEHEARMKEIEKNHQNALKAIQIQSEIETAKHESIMTRIANESKTIDQSGKLDVSNFSSKIYFIKTYSLFNSHNTKWLFLTK